MLGWCNSIICSAARPPNQAISRHLHPAKIPRKWMTDQTEGSRRGESAGDGHMQQGAIKRDGSCRGRHCRSLCIVSRPTRRDPREPPVFSAQLTRYWRGGRRAIGRPHWSKVSSTDLSHVLRGHSVRPSPPSTCGLPLPRVTPEPLCVKLVEVRIALVLALSVN